MGSLGLEVAKLGARRSDFETQDYTKVSENIEKLNHELLHILLPLKTHLSKEKSKDGPFDLTGDLANGSRIVDTILDFKNLFEANYGDKKRFSIKDLDFDKLENVTKEQLTELLSHIDNLETHHKTQTQDETQRLFLKVNLSLAIFNCLNETQKSNCQHVQRLAQASRVM